MATYQQQQPMMQQQQQQQSMWAAQQAAAQAAALQQQREAREEQQQEEQRRFQMQEAAAAQQQNGQLQAIRMQAQAQKDAEKDKERAENEKMAWHVLFALLGIAVLVGAVYFFVRLPELMAESAAGGISGAITGGGNIFKAIEHLFVDTTHVQQQQQQRRSLDARLSRRRWR